jgi:hypothetical protein
MRRPEETSQWFSRVSAEILDRVARAETESGEKRNNEFLSTVTDCRILAWLAKYHSQRLLAAMHYNLFKESGDVSPLNDAIAYERQAMAAWKEISLSAGDVYSDTLAFGVHRLGFNHHWREELPRFSQGLEKLTAERQQALKSLANGPLRIAHVPVRRLSPGGKLEVRASVFSGTPPESVALHLVEQEGGFRTIPLSVDQPGLFRCSVPLNRREGSVRYYLEAADSSGNRVYYPANGREDPISVTVTADVEPPHVHFEAVNQAQPGEDLRVSALVEDVSGAKSVRLRYRHLTQFDDYQLVEMRREGDTSRFAARVPGAFVQPEWDLMYFIEAIDNMGNGRMFPDLETEMPYVIVPVKR